MPRAARGLKDKRKKEESMAQYVLLKGQSERIKSRLGPMIISNDVCEYGTLTCFDTETFDVSRSYLYPHAFFECLVISEREYAGDTKKKASGRGIIALPRKDKTSPHRLVSLELRKEMGEAHGRTSCVVKKCDIPPLLIAPLQMITSKDTGFMNSLAEIKTYYDKKKVKERFIIEYTAAGLSLTGGIEATVITSINYRIGDGPIRSTGKELLQIEKDGITYCPEIAEALKKENVFQGDGSIYGIVAQKIVSEATKEKSAEKEKEKKAGSLSCAPEHLRQKQSFYF